MNAPPIESHENSSRQRMPIFGLLVTATIALVVGAIMLYWSVSRTGIRSVRNQGGRVSFNSLGARSGILEFIPIEEQILATDRDVINVLLSGESVDDSFLNVLKFFPSLISLQITGSQLTNQGLSSLQSISRLRYLRLEDCPGLTSGLFSELAEFPSLRDLSICDSSTTGVGVSRLKSLLSVSFIRCHDLEPTTYQELSELSLRDLNLEGSPVTDDNLRSLGTSSRLQSLDLTSTSISSSSLAVISAQFPNLVSLSLEGVEGITLDEVAHLENLKQLRFLNLGGTNLVDEVITDLQNSLPTCTILR